MKEQTCPHCGDAKLKLVSGRAPWTIEHLICPACDSTFNVGELDK